MKIVHLFLIAGLYGFTLYTTAIRYDQKSTGLSTKDQPYLWVLGIAQDAGYPQAGCKRECCRLVWKGSVESKKVSCLAIVDPAQKLAWLLDATPDFREQLHELEEQGLTLAGVFLTHAHIGHYTGLIQLGHEVMGARSILVYVMPRMKTYLEENGPWDQLVNFQNIVLRPLMADIAVPLFRGFQITPFLVPHRDEYSETVGYRLESTNKKALFIPDIDKWERWDRDIVEQVRQVDYAFLDATFYANGEITGRDMREIPHPFIEESMKYFNPLPLEERRKVHFIHFNHTNPVLNKESNAYRAVLNNGYNVAEEGRKYGFE